MPDLNPQETDALRDLLTQILPSLALTLSEQLNREASLELIDIEPVPIQTLLTMSDSLLQTIFGFSQPSGVESVFVLTEGTALVLADLMDGKDGTDPPTLLTEAHIDQLSAVMNGLIRGLVTALNNRGGEAVELESSSSQLGTMTLPPVFAMEGNAVQARLFFTLPDTHEAEAKFLFAPELVRALIPDTDEGVEGLTEGGDDILNEDELSAMLGEIAGDSEFAGTMDALPDAGQSAAPAMPFTPFAGAGQDSGLPRGFELILDIPLDVTVELGRVRMLIKDVLELASGSIVELDRVAGEPVDLLVNGRLVAKGEVVVIEDNFGLRITEIISPADRVTGLGKGR